MGQSTPNWRTSCRFLGILVYKSVWLLRNLEEPLHIFEELLAIHGSDVKRHTEVLLTQDANVHLILLQVRLCVTCVVHQVTGELVTLR
jgi:hypothetical protein